MLQENKRYSQQAECLGNEQQRLREARGTIILFMLVIVLGLLTVVHFVQGQLAYILSMVVAAALLPMFLKSYAQNYQELEEITAKLEDVTILSKRAELVLD